MSHIEYVTEEGSFKSVLFATIDHIVALAKGGRTTEDNIVVSCATCNFLKSIDIEY